MESGFKRSLGGQSQSHDEETNNPACARWGEFTCISLQDTWISRPILDCTAYCHALQVDRGVCGQWRHNERITVLLMEQSHLHQRQVKEGRLLPNTKASIRTCSVTSTSIRPRLTQANPIIAPSISISPTWSRSESADLDLFKVTE